VEESSSYLIEVISRHLSGGTEEKNTNCLNQDSRCPDRDSNRVPPECISRALPPDQLILELNVINVETKVRFRCSSSDTEQRECVCVGVEGC
jgi:hypothetical protein